MIWISNNPYPLSTPRSRSRYIDMMSSVAKQKAPALKNEHTNVRALDQREQLNNDAWTRNWSTDQQGSAPD
ncbi:hypothetical protein T4A_7968 [Trichinella pseudospiralis]|uniref:Uncharacterized protein n=1 Tax=Trichinella pseudospiralis TaxID=6337 RepID=A0A0V1E8K2_TRIPS|nr:hypothetical protein T4A_7968 [Trichinella pseudospiralis]